MRVLVELQEKGGADSAWACGLGYAGVDCIQNEGAVSGEGRRFVGLE